MTVVLMDGSVIRTKGSNRARKSTTGWDTGRLFLGSEGTLGVRSLDCAFTTGGADSLSHCPQIITELTVRLAPVVPLKVALTSFPSVAKAVTAVVDILGAGLTPTSLELLDGTSIRGLNLAKILPDELPEEPTVLMRFSNASDEVNRASLDTVAKIVKRVGARELRVAKNEEENDELWKARKVRRFLVSAPCSRACALLLCSLCTFARSRSTGRNSFSSVQAVVPWQVLLAFSSSAPANVGTTSSSQRQEVLELTSFLRSMRMQITDVCVPISRLAEFVARSEELVQRSGLVAPIVAHIGDGSASTDLSLSIGPPSRAREATLTRRLPADVHRAILWKGAEGETERPKEVEHLAKALVKLALELEGTCAGEHGIGCVPSP